MKNSRLVQENATKKPRKVAFSTNFHVNLIDSFEAKGFFDMLVRFIVIFGRITKLTSAAVLGLGLFVGSAHATTTTFEFFGARIGLGADETYVQDGITLEASSVSGDIQQNPNGIGVVGDVDANRLGSDATINESLTLTFSQTVTLVGSVVLEHRGGTEEFDILDSASNILGSFAISGDGGSSLVTLSDLGLTGETFTFSHTSGSGIRLNSVTINPVPLPAGLPMALVAFGGLALAARRRKAA